MANGSPFWGTENSARSQSRAVRRLSFVVPRILRPELGAMMEIHRSAPTKGGLSRISSAGGTAATVTELAQGETMHRWPQVLPGSNAVLFTAYTGGGPEDSNIDALSFKTHQRKTLVRGGEMARYVAGPNGEGYLVYLHQSALLAVTFDPRKLATAGTAQPILDDVRAMGQTYRGDFDVSQSGTLVYLGGSGEPGRSIFWLDPTGKTEPLHSAPGLYNGLQFSPDGKRLVFGMGDVLANEDLWFRTSNATPPCASRLLAA